ncbi:4-hydroxy-tetrahydrodipicolinate synthase [Thiomicrospira sp. ALE5]|uniref:4-hydroxy-tetrahydrodipicolinate synthase n=1 Tax=Thiomicrospira sp. ALE5 TaxID=748650 RepID=UPI000B830683|nr:4-hydroxy-tetrahydrodipicolinate synthase [Thiomicrospira sp. ALE5]
MVALVTPMNDDETIDYAALASLIEWHIESGTQAIVAVGTTGESATLDMTEHCDVIRFVAEKVAGRITVIAGTGANSTSEAIALTRCAKKAGADACLLVTPYYNKPTQEGLFLHYKKIAEAVDIPQILYNVPGRTACDLQPETIGRLSSIVNIIGVKEATGDLSRVAKIQALVPANFYLYSGDDATAVDFILLGGHGGISVTANIVPDQVARAYQAALDGDSNLAHELDQPLASLHQHLFVEANPIPVKWALAQTRKINPAIRLPLTPLSEPFHGLVSEALTQAGVTI